MPKRHFLGVPRCLWPAAAALAAASATFALPAFAEGLDVAVVLASDKVYRGISQSRGRAAMLLDLNGRTDTGWAAGVGLATLAPGIEWTATLSRAWQLDTEWALQAGAEHYGDSGVGRRLPAYDELFASLQWEGRMSGSIAASPDLHYTPAGVDGHGGWVIAYELGWREPVTASWALDAGIGYNDLRRVARTGYAYGSVGLSWNVAAALQFHLGLVGSNAAARGLTPTAVAGRRWIASLGWAF